jgi:hypothetical protein
VRLSGFRIGGMATEDGQGSGKERVSRMSASSHKRRRETIGAPPSRARFFRTPTSMSQGDRYGYWLPDAFWKRSSR